MPPDPPRKMTLELTPQVRARVAAYLRRNGFPELPGEQILNVEIVADAWVCTSCDSTVSGLPASYPKEAARCPGCGSPMEPDDGERYESPQATPQEGLQLDDAQVAAFFEMDANWTCGHCGSGGNRGDTTHCASCGAERPSATPAGKTRPPEREPLDVERPAPRRSRAPLLMGASLALFVTFVVVTSMDTQPTGVVTNARWIQTVRVEQYQPVIERDTKANIEPSAAVMPSEGQEPRPGAQIIECEGESCLYETYKWIEVDSRVRRGDITEPIPDDGDWAELRRPRHSRTQVFTRYDIDFEYQRNGETFRGEIRPLRAETFEGLQPGTEIEVELTPQLNVRSVTARGRP